MFKPCCNNLTTHLECWRQQPILNLCTPTRLVIYETWQLVIYKVQLLSITKTLNIQEAVYTCMWVIWTWKIDDKNCNGQQGGVGRLESTVKASSNTTNGPTEKEQFSVTLHSTSHIKISTTFSIIGDTSAYHQMNPQTQKLQHKVEFQ